LSQAGRDRQQFDRAFPFGYVATEPSSEAIADARAYWRSVGVDQEFDGITACFIGSIGHQTNVAGIVEAAKTLKSYRHARFVICGDGDRLQAVREKAAGLNNVTIPGWQRRAAIWTLLRMSDVGVAAYVNRADFLATIPNKVPEYLSGGLAVALNLRAGLTHELISQHSCGFSYEDDPCMLGAKLRELYEDEAALRLMRQNARALFVSRFRADAVYGEMIATLEELVESYCASHNRRSA
jgi:glycosyltransferase involved in cell wall biosynthesis